MNCEIKLSDDHKFIILTITGDFTGSAIMKSISEAHTLGSQLNVNRYMVDVTNAVNIDSHIKNYEFAYSNLDAMEGFDKTARVAGLISPDDYSHDFVETVVRNAGKEMKIFTERDKAIQYLLG